MWLIILHWEIQEHFSLNIRILYFLISCFLSLLFCFSNVSIDTRSCPNLLMMAWNCHTRGRTSWGPDPTTLLCQHCYLCDKLQTHLPLTWFLPEELDPRSFPIPNLPHPLMSDSHVWNLPLLLTTSSPSFVNSHHLWVLS